jgi:ubiquinone/menaquinone biosynthesis C-methylase UbiE
VITTIQNYIYEVYRHRSKSLDINDLSGRLARPDLTKFVNEQILASLSIKDHSSLVDVGCGDASLLILIKKHIEKFQGTLIGISPTFEEVSRLRLHINSEDIKIIQGTASKIELPKDSTDFIVCNSVLHGGGQTSESVKLALKEFNRILKIKGVLYIGELSDCDELRTIEIQQDQRLLAFIKIKEFLYFCGKLVLMCFTKSEPILIGPRFMYFSSPTNFIHTLSNYGFLVTRYVRHQEIDSLGNKFDSSCRWNYIAIKLRSI